MGLKLNNKFIVIAIFILFLSITIPKTHALSFNNLDARSNFSVNSWANFVENFTTITNADFSSSVWGWGHGSVSKERNFSVVPLDFLETPGNVHDIDVQGRKVYAAFYNASTTVDSFGCVDINNPNDIRLLSTRNSFRGMSSIAIDGDSLYVGKHGVLGSPANYLNFYNASDPFNLGGSDYLIDTIFPSGLVTDIEPQGHLVYFTSYGDTLDKSFRIVDAADPNNTKNIIPSWNNNNSLGLAISGHFAYIAASTDGMYILNVSDKYDPIQVGHLNLPGNATDVIVEGRFAYASLGEAGVAAIDIFNPSTPQILDVFDTDGFANRMVLQGNTLFIADGANGVVVLDVANPNHLTFVTDFILPYTWDVDLWGGTLVVGTDYGIHTFYVCASGGNGMTDFSKYYYENAFDDFECWDVRVVGDIAFIAGGPDGFYTLNIRYPDNPILLDRIEAPSGERFRKLDVQGQFAHIISNHNYSIIDIRDPANLKIAGSVGGNELLDVDVKGELVYITWQLGGYACINVTYPNLLAWGNELNEPHFGTNITAIDVQGYHVYTVDNLGVWGNAFYVHDQLNLTDHFITSINPYNAHNYDIFVDGDVALYADEYWVGIYNITNPYNKFHINDVNNGTYWIPGRGVWGFGPYIMSVGSHGAHLTDARIFSSTKFTNYDKATGGLQIIASGDYTYVANRSSLIILRHFESAGDTYIDGSSIAQSNEIDSTEDIIYKATLDSEAYVPFDSTVNYYLSADGGNHWEPVSIGVEHTFINPGNELRWRAELTSSTDRSPHLYEITIDYFFNERPTTPVLNDPGVRISTSSVTITWYPSTDDAILDYYELQVDTENSFTTPMREFNVSGTMQDITGLTNGTYYFRVRAVDEYNLSSEWSNIEDLIVEIPALDIPWWYYVIAGGVLVAIILTIVIVVRVRRNKRMSVR